jgi:hypothetical protein
MVLPVVSLLLAVAVRRAAGALGEAIPSACFALACAGLLVANRAFWFEQTPEMACRFLFKGNPFSEAVVIAKHIQEHSSASDTIAIMGSEPEIFFLAHRHSATGYIYMYDLMQHHRHAPAMQKETVQQIEAAKPAFLVLVTVDTSWSFYKDSELNILNWAREYSRSYYDLAGKIWILPDRTEFVWGAEAMTRAFGTSPHVSVFKRKPGV